MTARGAHAGAQSNMNRPSSSLRSCGVGRLSPDGCPARIFCSPSTLKQEAAGGWVLRNPRELEAHVYETNVDLSIWPRISSLNCPVILIGADPAHPFAMPPALICKAIHDEHGVDYVMVPDTTHFLQIEKPEACRRALKDFVTRLG